MKNNKRNHHFIAQTEQSFHARNADVKSKKINRFAVIDKSKREVKKTSRKGRSISSNLSFNDLYCFDFLSNDEQYNFEEAFGKYETNYHALVREIVDSGNCSESVLLDLFTYKWMNIIRNPFCIKNVLRTFSRYLKSAPTEPELLSLFKRIDDGYKPQENRVCEEYNITKFEYINWLKLLFLVLQVRSNDVCLLELLTRTMFYEQASSLNIFIFSVEQKPTVFSDIGFTLVGDGLHWCYEFPLTDSCYIAFGFTDLDLFSKKVSKDNGIDLTKVNEALKSKPKSIRVKVIDNDLPRLDAFNGRMIEQSCKYVFSKGSEVIV